MSFKVEILPSGNSFIAEAEESLLEAALRSGISVAYRCSSGKCGECSASLKSGSLRKKKVHDFPIGEADRLTGKFLLCSNRAASDLQIEMVELSNPDSVPLQSMPMKVYRIDQVDQDHLILYLKTRRGQIFQFMPGQALVLELEGVGRYAAPIASCPCNGQIVELHLPLYHKNGLIKELDHFLQQHKGMPNLQIEGPFGNYTLHENKANVPEVFITVDGCFASVKGVIEQLDHRQVTHPVELVWLTTGGRQHYQENFCHAWQDQMEDFKYKLITSSRAEIDSDLHKSVYYLIQKYRDLKDGYIYISAPERLQKKVISLFIDQGFMPEQLIPLGDNCLRAADEL